MDFGNTQTAGQVVLGTVLKKSGSRHPGNMRPVGSLKVITRFREIRESEGGGFRSEAARWQKRWKNRTCSLTPHWRNSGAISSGRCSVTA